MLWHFVVGSSAPLATAPSAPAHKPSAPAHKPSHSSETFFVKGFLPLWVSGICWHWARWGIAFLSAYYVNKVTDSPRMVQLTGAVIWSPLLLVGLIGGVVSDRFDRLRTVQIQLLPLIPLAVLVGWAEQTERLSLWLLYPFLLVAGLGWVGDMTSRRALVMDLVRPAQLHRAVTMETISLASGIAIGNLLGGTIADRFGVGVAFYVVAGLLIVAFLLLHLVPSGAVLATAKQPQAPCQLETLRQLETPLQLEALRQSASSELREGLRLVRTNHTLRSILGVTVLANAFYFSHFPTVQRVGDRLGASPTQIGIIASMTGFGMIVGSVITSVGVAKRWGIAYVTGAFGAMIMLVPFGTAPSVTFAAVALFLSSCAIGLFAATQPTLVLTTVDADKSSRAMGLLSMSIGVLPLGTFVLGEVAEQVGAGMALVSMPSLGILALALWLIPNRIVLSCRAPSG